MTEVLIGMLIVVALFTLFVGVLVVHDAYFKSEKEPKEGRE